MLSKRVFDKLNKRITAIFSKNFPNKKIISIQELDSHNNYVFLVDLEKKSYVIKFPRNAKVWQLKKEVEIINLLRNRISGIPVPKIVKTGFAKKNRSYVITEKILGENLKNCVVKFSSSEKKLILSQIGEILGKIHAIKFNHFGDLNENLKVVKPEKDFFESYKKTTLESLEKIKKFFSKSTYKKCLSYLKNLPNNMKFEPVLEPSDRGFSNFLVQNSKITGVLDFEFARADDKIASLTKIYNYHMRPFLKTEFINGYKRYSSLSKDYKEKIRMLTFKKLVGEISFIKNMTFKGMTLEKTNRLRAELIERDIKNLQKLLAGRPIIESFNHKMRDVLL